MALLQIAWTNCHSGFVIGPAMVSDMHATMTLSRCRPCGDRAAGRPAPHAMETRIHLKKNDFLRGYHIEFGGGRGQPDAGSFDGFEEINGGGYGVGLKRDIRKMYGAQIGMSGRGEMIPNENSFCEIDPHVVDQWGIPVLRFHFKWSQDEILQAKHMQETFVEIIEAAGGKVMSKADASSNWGISRGGEIIHEVGATKMGEAWDCKNLFVTDAAPFVSNADKNPTLTITALGWRTSDYIVEQVKKFDVKV